MATRFAPADAAREAPSYSSIPMQSWTLNGVGRSILKWANTIYVGGSFTQAISPDGNQRVDRRNLAAFDATTTVAPTTTAAQTTTVAPTTTTSPPPSGAAVSIAPDAEWACLDDGSDPTTYFRHRFTSAGTPSNLTLTLRIDDGALVRINGVEAYRFNTPSTAINFRTRAVVAISDSNERLDRTITLDPLLVVPGTNVITVEVHQDSFGSSDITFFASLTGRF